MVLQLHMTCGGGSFGAGYSRRLSDLGGVVVRVFASLGGEVRDGNNLEMVTFTPARQIAPTAAGVHVKCACTKSKLQTWLR